MSNQDVLSVSGAIWDRETVNRIHFNIMRIHVIRHMSAFSPLLFKSQRAIQNLTIISEPGVNKRGIGVF